MFFQEYSSEYHSNLIGLSVVGIQNQICGSGLNKFQDFTIWLGVEVVNAIYNSDCCDTWFPTLMKVPPLYIRWVISWHVMIHDAMS